MNKRKAIEMKAYDSKKMAQLRNKVAKDSYDLQIVGIRL